MLEGLVRWLMLNPSLLLVYLFKSIGTFLRSVVRQRILVLAAAGYKLLKNVVFIRRSRLLLIGAPLEVKRAFTGARFVRWVFSVLNLGGLITFIA